MKFQMHTAQNAVFDKRTCLIFTLVFTEADVFPAAVFEADNRFGNSAFNFFLRMIGIIDRGRMSAQRRRG